MVMEKNKIELGSKKPPKFPRETKEDNHKRKVVSKKNSYEHLSLGFPTRSDTNQAGHRRSRDCKRLEILDLGCRGIVLSMLQKQRH